MANELTYQSVFTGQEMDERFTAVAQLQAALLEVETALSAKYVKPASGIPETDLDSAVQSALAKARSAVQDLSNYYTKTEIDSLLAAVNSQEYVDVATLPTAGASTLGKIYLVGPTNNQYDRYYTSYDGSDYSWVAAGSTEINLSNYATKAELGQLDQEVNGFEYTGSFTISATGEHSSNSDRITFPKPILAGEYKILLATGTTGNSGNAGVFVKYVGGSSTTNIGNATIGTEKSFTFANPVESIGIYMSASVNQHTGTMPITINSTAVSIIQELHDAEDAIEELNLDLIEENQNIDGLNVTASLSPIKAATQTICTFDALAGKTYAINVSLLAESGEIYFGVKFADGSTQNLGGVAVGVTKKTFNYTPNATQLDLILYVSYYHNPTASQSIEVEINTDGKIDDIYRTMIGKTFSKEDAPLGNGRTGVLSIPLFKGLRVKVSVDIEGAVSRSGELYPGWFDGNTTNVIDVPSSAKPTILSSVSHIEFDYTPDQDYPNGLFGLSNYDYSESNIQYATVTLEYASLEVRLADVENILAEEGIGGTSIFSFNPKDEVTQKLAQITRETINIDTGAPYANSIVSLLHFSDIHGQQVNLERIITFGNKYANYLNDIVSSGDQVPSLYGDSFAFWNNAGAQKVLLALGNHEVWKNDTTKESDPQSAADCYSKFISPNIAQWGVTSPGTGLCYYYKDYNAAGSYPLRFIVIDCVHIDQAQTTWFTNVLADAKANGYTVVIMSHYSPSPLVDVQFNNDSTFTCVEGPRNWTGYATVVPFELLVKNFVDGGGKFACWLCGHLHWDMFGLSEHGQPIISIECATTIRQDRFDARVIGTKTQDSFNIVAFDTYKGLIRVLRIGNDMDRLMRPKETLCFDYINKEGIYNA